MTANERADTRQRLLDAAREELAAEGLATLSLRAVARRAGLSHAAPAHFFIDRAGLLAAVATEGFEELARQLDAVADGGLTALGQAYVRFGSENPSLIDVMFRNADLREDDPDLVRAKQEAIGRLVAAVARTRAGADAPSWTLISWALVHGLVVLGREGVLAATAGREPGADREVSDRLIELYVQGISEALTR